MRALYHRHGARHHHHHHDHAHTHDHAGHSHTPQSFGWAFAIAASLNAGFVVAELVFGYAANSLALISDAVHNLSDVIALLLAWGAAWLAQKQPTQRHTYGYRRASILAALFNAGLLLVAVGGIIVEAINRLQEPAAVAGWTVVMVAALGILIQWRHPPPRLFVHARPPLATSYPWPPICTWRPMPAFSLGWVVRSPRHHADGWLWVDPRSALVIAAVVLASGWGLARDSVNLALDGPCRAASSF